MKIIFFALLVTITATATAKGIEANKTYDGLESKISIDPAEKKLRLVDYSNCYFVANNYPTSGTQWDRMCSKLGSELGSILRGACYRNSDASYQMKKGFCFNFNH